MRSDCAERTLAHFCRHADSAKHLFIINYVYYFNDAHSLHTTHVHQHTKLKHSAGIKHKHKHMECHTISAPCRGLMLHNPTVVMVATLTLINVRHAGMLCCWQIEFHTGFALTKCKCRSNLKYKTLRHKERNQANTHKRTHTHKHSHQRTSIQMIWKAAIAATLFMQHLCSLCLLLVFVWVCVCADGFNGQQMA